MSDEWLSPHEILYGSCPRLPLLPFLQPVYHCVPRQRKTDPRARMYYFLNFGHNHGRDFYQLLDAETGRSLIRATSPGTTLKHHGSLQSGLRQQNRRRISTSHTQVCARRRAVSRTRRRSASSRTGNDATAYTYVELPGSDSSARWPRIRTLGIRRDAREDAWRDPCSARCIAGIPPSPRSTVGSCGYDGVNAGEGRINQRERPSTQRLERLAGRADRACIRPLYTK